MSGLAAQPTDTVLRKDNPEDGADDFFDECLTNEGAVRPHWQALMAGFEQLGPRELAARAGNVRRMLREQGVTCSVQTDPAGSDEPWQLDLFPLIIAAAEWRDLEAGLVQRANLLNRILADLYGTQRLVRDGLIPAPLIFANPGYLRPCQALEVRDNIYLLGYSADLARSPDGRWWVIAERTQAPTGFGFALHNRSILSRVLPEVMRELQPRPVLDFLRLRREALRRFAPGQVTNPSIALLTPGPGNEAYFEHTYLARVLGLNLVEGDDLTVRDRRVWVKTLSGLRKVDVVLRRVSDVFCDPLELRDDSLLGVPGLLDAVRAGNVSIGNAIGTGLLESPAFMPFLPGLCRRLLGEDLRLPSPATWWCGQPRELAYVQAHWRELVVRPAFTPSGLSLTASGLDEVAESALMRKLELTPHEFIGQEQVMLSRGPVFREGGASSGPLVLRVFVMYNGSEFVVMPGGLARVLDIPSIGSVPVPLSGLSKDVWVLPDTSDSPPPPAGFMLAPWPHTEGVHSDLPSRAADNLFWLGRYTERLEQIVRYSRHALARVGDTGPGHERLVPLRTLLSHLGLLVTPNTPDIREGLQQDLLALVYDPARTDGVRDLLRRIHLSAFSVRDRLSADTWHLFNRLRTYAVTRPGGLPLVEASGTLHALVIDLAALSGMEMENMTRGNGWVFMDMGRRIERSLFLVRLMDALWRTAQGWEVVIEVPLEIADSVMTHRRRYFSEPTISSVMEVLVYDVSNPRSLAFQFASLRDHAAILPMGSNPEGVASLRSMVQQLGQQLDALRSGGTADVTGGNAALLNTLGDMTARLARLSQLVTEVYFSHVSPQVS